MPPYSARGAFFSLFTEKWHEQEKLKEDKLRTVNYIIKEQIKL